MNPDKVVKVNERGESLYNNIYLSFKAARNETTNQIDILKYTEATATILPVYECIFGSNMITKVLQDDLTNSAKDLKESVLKNPIERETIDSLVKDEIKELGIKKLKVKTCGTSGLLWSKRALDLIVTFLDKCILSIEYQGKQAKDAAYAAYCEVLKPYHGIIVSNLARLAFNLCPSKSQIILLLGFNDEAVVTERVKQLVGLLRPILNEIHNILVENGCDFSDKI